MPYLVHFGLKIGLRGQTMTKPKKQREAEARKESDVKNLVILSLAVATILITMFVMAD